MSASASPDEVVLPGRADRAAPGAGRGIRLVWVEATLAAVAFAALCVVVLSVAPQIAEPDDGAYRHSIVAITEGRFPDVVKGSGECAGSRKLGGPGRPDPEPMGRAGQRAVYQREGPRLSVPRGAVPGARHHPVGAAVLRGTGLPWAVHRRPALARALRWPGSGGPVLLIRSRAGVRLARLHADVHRRLADRGGFRDPAVGGAGNRGQFPAAHLGRPRRIRRDRDRDFRPLHQYRDPRLRRRGRDRGVAAASREAAPPHAVLVACVGGRLRRGRGHLR